MTSLMTRGDLQPGALLHLTTQRLGIDGLGIILGKYKRKSQTAGYNILFKGEVITFCATSTPTKLILSARGVNPQQPNIYYSFKPTLIAGSTHDRQ